MSEKTHDYSEDQNLHFETHVKCARVLAEKSIEHNHAEIRCTTQYTVWRAKPWYFLLTKTKWEIQKQETNKNKNMVHSVSFKNTKNNDEIALTFKWDN